MPIMPAQTCSTEQLLNIVSAKLPDADPSALLEVIVACDADLNQVFRMLGIRGTSSSVSQFQSTFKVHKDTRSPRTRAGKPELLHTPSDVARAGILCTLHCNVLETSVANSVALSVAEDCKQWKYTRYHLFDREVGANHRTGLYADDPHVIVETRSDPAYSAYVSSSKCSFPPEMARAREVVVAEVHKLNPQWSCNLVAANVYNNKSENLSYHSDRLTHLGPKPIIAALSFGATREFRLKRRRPRPDDPSYWSIRLPHNSMVVMHGGCQEHFKHSVPALRTLSPHPLLGTMRISLTFRYSHPDFTDDRIPRCHCNKTMILRTTVKSTSDENFKYIWSCGQPYTGEPGCGQVHEAHFYSS